MTLKELRIFKGLTQEQAAALCSVSLRSYKSYENEKSKADTIKYRYMLTVMEEFNKTDETHGILSIEEIKEKCVAVFEGYDVSFCYLFGSYAKGTPKESSDVDLLVSVALTGLKFFGLAEKLRTSLNKKVDLLDMHQVENNPVLLSEILKDGIKIYG